MAFLAAIPPMLAGMGATTAATSMAGALGSSGLIGAGTSSLAVGAGSFLPSLSTVLSVAGTGIAAAGQMSAANAQADAMEANAEMFRREGEGKRIAAEAETLKLSNQKRQLIGQQTALYGASGVDISTGSPLDVMADTASQFERDIQYAGYRGDVGLQNSNIEADAYDAGSKARRRAGWINAGGTLLTGFGRSLLGKYSGGIA